MGLTGSYRGQAEGARWTGTVTVPYQHPMTPETSRTFVELFAGGGMVRAAVGPGWRCLLANDFSEAKADSYAANWTAEELVVGDIKAVRAEQITGRPDLVWMSSPCQDVSNAGLRSGLDGGRSGALWAAMDLVRQLAFAGRAPRLVALENVLGMASSKGGDDLAAVATALADAGYQCGAVAFDAKMVVPQSRPRLVIIAVADDVARPPDLLSPQPTRPWHPASIVAAAEQLPTRVRERWLWWHPPAPPPRRADLVDLLEEVADTAWRSQAEVDALLALMSERDRSALDHARAKRTAVGTLTRRMRPDGGGGRLQRAELRLDGVAGCLRTPGGGSSEQFLLVADKSSIKVRKLTARECARLMGLPDTYKLPRKRDQALQLLGDGVAVPVVRHLAKTVFEPLLAAGQPSPLKAPRTGIKGKTRATTLYLLPHELQRLRRLAVDLDVPLHDLMLRGLDRVLAEQGQRPLERYRGQD